MFARSRRERVNKEALSNCFLIKLIALPEFKSYCNVLQGGTSRIPRALEATGTNLDIQE